MAGGTCAGGIGVIEIRRAPCRRVVTYTALQCRSDMIRSFARGGGAVVTTGTIRPGECMVDARRLPGIGRVADVTVE